jgi:glyoxylase-like metal-dependent hydrolase (beta-lactamase superfamily II)
MLRRLVPCLLLLCASARPACALEPVRVAEGVYAFIGDLGEIAPDNGGNIGNSGFIVGRTGVIVIDTGISYRHGQAMLDAIHHVSDKPVQLVIVTHAVQEFLFGNAAFAELGTPLLTHAKSVELMRQRCDHCLANLRKILGEQTMAGTRLVLPERTVERSTTLEVAGRRLELLYLGWASTPGDLAVLDHDSGVLFAGGLVTSGRIPEVRDADIDGWLQALEQLAQVPVQAVVPGHGPVGRGEMIQATADYLRALDREVQALYGSGTSLMEAVDAAVLPGYSNWSLYPSLHRQNALHRYLQLEVRDLGG